MKILIFTEFFPPTENAPITGGVEKRTVEFAKRLSRFSEVTVVCSHQPGYQRWSELYGCTVRRYGITYPYCNEGHIIKRLSFAASAFYNCMRKEQPTIIDTTCFLCYLPAGLLSIMKSIPCVITYHEVWTGRWIKMKGFITGILGEIWEWLAIKFPWRRFIAVSQTTADSLSARHISKHRLVVIPNGIDKNILMKNHNKSKVNGNVISCVGRLVAGKQIDVLLDAVSLAKRRGVLVYIKIVGEGPEYKKLRNQAENLGINDQISFLGRLAKNSDVYEVIRSSKVFCLPSEVEGFGITLLETMALGVPFIASDIPVIREVTNGGTGGILCSPGDSAEYCDAIIRLLNRPEYRKKLANEGRQLSKQYNWDILSKRMLNLYKDVLNETNLKSESTGPERFRRRRLRSVK